MNPLPTTIDNGGDSLTIRTVGDEHYRYTQTEDGVLVVSDSNGVYYYADETGAARSTASIMKNIRTALNAPQGNAPSVPPGYRRPRALR